MRLPIAHILAAQELTQREGQKHSRFFCEVPPEFRVTSLQHAHELLEIDRQLARPSLAWTEYFISAMMSYFRGRTDGLTRASTDAKSDVLSNEATAWLLENFTAKASVKPSASASAFLFALVRNMEMVPDSIMSLALHHAKGRLALSPIYQSDARLPKAFSPLEQ